MKTITINLPAKYLTFLREIADNRSETIRSILSSFLLEEKEFAEKLNPDDTELKICTVNIPEEFVKEIENIVDQGLYPSRSELLRSCIREAIIKKLRMNELLDKAFPMNEAPKNIPETEVKDFTILEENEEEKYFILQTKVLGTKDDFLRSKALISVPHHDSLLQIDKKDYEFEPQFNIGW